MRKLFTFLSIVLLVVGCRNNSATIEIAVVGTEDSVIYIMRPYNGFTTGFTDTISCSPGKSVFVDIDISDVTSFSISNKNNYLRLVAEPSDMYKVTFDYTHGDLKIHVSDSAQTAYNRIFADKNMYKYEFVRDYGKFPVDSVASKMKSNFDKFISDDIAALQSVKMSDSKRKYIETDIRLYWLSSLSKILRSNYYGEHRNGTPMYDGYMDLWGEIYNRCPIDENIVASTYFTDYTKLYFTYKDDYKQAKSIEEYWSDKFNSIYNNISDKSIREVILTQNIYYECLNNKTMNGAIIPYIDKLKSEYPKSKHIRLINDFVGQIDDFNNKIKDEFTPGVKFVEDGENISSFKELISKFEGKPVFIDFWFSTCGPCRQQFSYNKPLKKFLADNGVEMLYISIDRDKTDWENSIKYFNLEGWHIKAEKALWDDIYNGYGIYLFPTYMVVNKEGDVVVDRAMEPEKGEELYSQIKNAL